MTKQSDVLNGIVLHTKHFQFFIQMVIGLCSLSSLTTRRTFDHPTMILKMILVRQENYHGFGWYHHRVGCQGQLLLPTRSTTVCGHGIIINIFYSVRRLHTAVLLCFQSQLCPANHLIMCFYSYVCGVGQDKSPCRSME
jgi:hypothetical protein